MRTVLIISVVTFLIACCLPAMEFTGKPQGNDVLWGGNVLGVGWSGIFAGVIGWYANLFWVLALVLGFIGKPKFAAAAGLAAIVIGSTTFTLFGKVLPGDEGDVTHITLVRLLPGCYVWLASLAVLPFGVFFGGK
jgi:hypothetical protein